MKKLILFTTIVAAILLTGCTQNTVTKDEQDNKIAKLQRELDLTKNQLEEEKMTNENLKNNSSNIQNDNNEISINKNITSIDDTWNQYINEKQGISFNFPKALGDPHEQYPESAINMGGIKMSVIDLNNDNEIIDAIRKKFGESCLIRNKSQSKSQESILDILIGDGKPLGETNCLVHSGIHYNPVRKKLYIMELSNGLSWCIENQCYDKEIFDSLKYL